MKCHRTNSFLMKLECLVRSGCQIQVKPHHTTVIRAYDDMITCVAYGEGA